MLYYSIDYSESTFTVTVVPINNGGAGQPAIIAISLSCLVDGELYFFILMHDVMV